MSSKKTVSHYRDSRILTVRDIRRRSEEKKGTAQNTNSNGFQQVNDFRKFYETQRTKQTFFSRMFKSIKKKETRELVNEELKNNEENITERKLLTEDNKQFTPRNNATIRPTNKISRKNIIE
jgi:hypothetical protein